MDPLTRDHLEERRRKWRRSAFWRGVLVTLGIFFLLGLIGAYFADPRIRPHIARVEINDVIYHDRARNAFIRHLSQDENVQAVIVHISSPGGTAVGSETLFNTLRTVADAKPLVSVMGEVAASGGYIAAIASDHVIARGNTATGSIGVIMEYPDVTGLMERVGVEMVTIRSSELKSGPSPFRPLSPEARAVEEEMLRDSNAWFRALVQDRRALTDAQLTEVADGRVLTGRQALTAGLVDVLGDEITARSHLESLNPALADLDIVTWAMDEDEGALGWIMGRISGFAGNVGGLGDRSGPRLMTILK